ncbi:MAG: hypothetical protein WC188_04550 [Candidatus Caldatribacteriota bacterium]
MIKILILNGTPQSGKDTFCDFIKDICKDKIVYYENISSVDHIKELAELYFGWDGKKDFAGRQLLSDLKDASTKYNNGPFNEVINKINMSMFYNSKKYMDFLFTIHCREIPEIEKFKEYYNEICSNFCYTVFIKRNLIDDNKNCYCDRQDYLENYKYDIIIDNNSDLDSLRRKTSDLLRTLKLLPD